jgi:DNA-binding response OmpR family regulator
VEHVLLVEDEPVLRKLICTFLRSEDYIVEEADSVEGAKRIIDTELIDLIVSDFRLGPDTAGDLYQWLLEKYPRMSSRLIVISGWPDIEGFPYFLPKPFRVGELITIIRMAMDLPITEEVAAPNSRTREMF